MFAAFEDKLHGTRGGGGARIVVICSSKLPPDLFGTGSSVLRNACFVPNLQLRSASHQPHMHGGAVSALGTLHGQGEAEMHVEPGWRFFQKRNTFFCAKRSDVGPSLFTLSGDRAVCC